MSDIANETKSTESQTKAAPVQAEQSKPKTTKTPQPQTDGQKTDKPTKPKTFKSKTDKDGNPIKYKKKPNPNQKKKVQKPKIERREFTPEENAEFFALVKSLVPLESKEEDVKKALDLVNQGADPNLKDETNNTVLMWAAGQGHTGLTKALIKFGADINAQDSMGRTALYWAARGGFPNAVQALIEAKADPNIKTQWQGGAILAGARSPSSKVVAALIKAGADIFIVDDYNMTALLYAARRGNPEMIDALLEAGAGSDIQRISEQGDNLISITGFGGNPDVAERFIDMGLDINHVGSFGETALLKATRRGKTRLVKLLLSRGADKTIKNQDGKTAEEIARESGNKNLIALFEAPKKPAPAPKKKKAAKQEKDNEPAAEEAQEKAPVKEKVSKEEREAKAKSKKTLIVKKKVGKKII